MKTLSIVENNNYVTFPLYLQIKRVAIKINNRLSVRLKAFIERYGITAIKTHSLSTKLTKLTVIEVKTNAVPLWTT